MKIAILVNQMLNYYTNFEQEAKKARVDLSLYTYQDITTIQLSPQLNQIKCQQQDLKNFDLIYIKNSEQQLELATLITKYCLDNEVKVIDTALIKPQPWLDSKAFEVLTLSNKNLPTIPSIFINQTQINQIKTHIDYPCVIKKSRFSSKGKDVYLASKEEEAYKIFEKYQEPLLVQQFIPNQSDFRFLVIDNQVVAAMERIRSKDESFLNNIAKGARPVAYQPEAQEAKLAVQAAQTLNYQIAGIDLFRTPQGWKIIEINRSPGFSGLIKATQINIYQKILQFFIETIK